MPARTRRVQPTFRIDHTTKDARVIFNPCFMWVLRQVPFTKVRLHKSLPVVIFSESWEQEGNHRLIRGKVPMCYSVELVERLLAKGFLPKQVYLGKKEPLGVRFTVDDRRDYIPTEAARR